MCIEMSKQIVYPANMMQWLKMSSNKNCVPIRFYNDIKVIYSLQKQ